MKRQLSEWEKIFASKLTDGSDVKVSAYNVGDPGSIPGLGRSPGEGNGNPQMQASWLMSTALTYVQA